MKGKLVFVGLILALLGSTNPQGGYKSSISFTSAAFKQARTLSGEIFLDLTFASSQIYFHNSKLYLKETDYPPIIHVLNAKTKEKTNEIVVKENWPKEMVFINQIQFIPGTNDFWVFDAASKKSIKYAASHDIYQIKERIKLDDVGSYNPLIIPSIGILANSSQTKPMGRFFLFDNKGARKKVLENYPDYGKELPNQLIPESFKCRSDIKPDFSKIVLAYELTDLLEIYDTKGHLLKRVHGPDQFYPDLVQKAMGKGNIEGVVAYKTFPTQNTREAYITVKAGPKEIWALYADGKKPSENYHHSTILVFDWEGNPLRKYTLDIPIFYFDVDWENNVLYGLKHSPKTSIVRYKLL